MREKPNNTSESQDNITIKLQQLLDTHKDKRVVVVGTTCTGKSTFLRHLPEALDMDELVFPLLTKAEHDYVCQIPWTQEIGNTMTRLTKERVKVQPGKPVFGTVVLDADLIINLKISDDLLRYRTQSRKVDFNDAKNMQQQIEKEIEDSGISKVDFNIG